MSEAKIWDDYYADEDARLNWYPQLNVVRFFCGLKNKGEFLTEHDIKLTFRPDMRVLDFGCGNGRHTKFLIDEGYMNVCACDLSPIAVRQCRELAPEALVVQIEPPLSNFEPRNLKGIPFMKGVFDIVMSEGVFDHMNSKDRKFYFKEVRRVLKPDGIFFLSLIKGNGREEVIESGLEKGLTQKYFTQRGIIKELEDFEIISIELTARHLTYPRREVIIDRYSIFAK